jgi:hypothetical protein
MMQRIFICLFIVFMGHIQAQTLDRNKYWASEVDVPSFYLDKYVCYRTFSPIVVDGIPDEQSWKKVKWTADFQDIRGGSFPKPLFSTKVKMLWDDQYFYIAARLEEPHIQGTITKHDAVIFHDNDFEVFIDPDGDTHLYYEFEINALNAFWDLLLIKPYRDGGPSVTSFETEGIKTAVHICGTMNDPSDKDTCWYAEIAFPIAVIDELNGKGKTKDGCQWRVNFSRVEWHTKTVDGKYEKVEDPKTGKPLPEENWVWSPQGVINMHRPETWGFVQFSDVEAGGKEVDFIFNEDENIKWALRNIYLAQRLYRSKLGCFANSLKQLRKIGFKPDVMPYKVTLKTGWQTYEVKGLGKNADWFIDNDGRIWRVK